MLFDWTSFSSGHFNPDKGGVGLLNIRYDRCKEGTGGREQYLLFPLFIPLECGGAPCLLCLVLQELCSSLFLFEHVQLVIKGLLLLLQFLFLVLVELL